MFSIIITNKTIVIACKRLKTLIPKKIDNNIPIIIMMEKIINTTLIMTFITLIIVILILLSTFFSILGIIASNNNDEIPWAMKMNINGRMIIILINAIGNIIINPKQKRQKSKLEIKKPVIDCINMNIKKIFLFILYP